MRLTIVFTVLLGMFAGMSDAVPTISTPDEQMRLDLRRSHVQRAHDGWDVTLHMEADNGSHPDLGFRAWWHCRLDGFDPATSETLHVRVTNAGYSDPILPVWSLDGGPYVRMPGGAVPVVTRDGAGPYTHRFTVTVPEGVQSVRMAKYFPYTISEKKAFINSLLSDPRVQVSITGHSRQGRYIERLDITAPDAPDAQKERVWIHGTVHPSETTTAFVFQGLIGFLLSDDPRAVRLLKRTIFNIVPMVNPDGVAAGNYRTDTENANLEDEWIAPYTSKKPEIRGLQDDIERFMGTPEAPGSHPIRILLNLHSANGDFPFHFQHLPLWEQPGDQGVTREIYDLEMKWIRLFKARSPFLRLGKTEASRLLRGDERPYIEAMMFDRYTNTPEWRAVSNFEPIMAITFEGTYSFGPGGEGDWNTPDDYRQIGREMALTISDFLGITPEAELPEPVEVEDIAAEIEKEEQAELEEEPAFPAAVPEQVQSDGDSH